MSERIFGQIPGFPPGARFKSRRELMDAGLHRHNQWGISWRPGQAADAIVLSGGYGDDCDERDMIIYTGEGGRDATTRRQIADQRMERGNAALALSRVHALPVRVIRGASKGPDAGYTYEGLFYVADYWREVGRDGFLIWRFLLVRDLAAQDPGLAAGRQVSESAQLYAPAARQQVTLARIIRDTELARAVKQLYEYTCQVCATRLDSAVGPYAEAAHIRPLGRPHDGPDSVANLLCLCPNHHVTFDYGAWTIGERGELMGLRGALELHPRHELDQACVAYHRERLFTPV